MCENLAKPITLADMAAAVALSEFHFSRAFKATTGMPPMRYLLQKRLRLGRKLLIETDMAIVDVAMACGFASHSHFASTFKRAEGLPPCEFRRVNQPARTPCTQAHQPSYS